MSVQSLSKPMFAFAQDARLFQHELTDDLAPFEVPDGMAASIFVDKYSRKVGERHQTWAERLTEVVIGNFSLDPRLKLNYRHDMSPRIRAREDYIRQHNLSVAGIMAYSGRHLQHGDINQSEHWQERFTNCSSALFSFVLFSLLLEGSGVGSDYSGNLRRVNYDFMPNCRFVLEAPSYENGVSKPGHPDYEEWIESLRDAQHKYPSESEDVRWFQVEDSREGWVKMMEIIETATYQQKHTNKLFIFDLSKVRERGRPIMGQQGRPASGPVPLIRAFQKICSLKGVGMKPWMQALFIDHYLSETVQLGGIRRSARIAVKWWKDRDVLDFIDIKRGGHLWSANMSVVVDEEFYQQARDPRPSWGRRVFMAMLEANYFDNTGEPGFINIDMFNQDRRGLDQITGTDVLSPRSKLGKFHRRTVSMVEDLMNYVEKHPYLCISNPCSEIPLAVYGGYCVVGSVNLAQCKRLEQATEAARLMTQSLIRVNLMPSLYEAEVKRTNRIGVSFMGIFEFAWTHFGLNFFSLIDEKRSRHFWKFMADLRHTIEKEARDYSEEIGVATPLTAIALKPEGTVAKVMNVSAAANLDSVRYMLRNVLVPTGSDMLREHHERGYRSIDLTGTQYSGYHAVSFPMQTRCAELMGDQAVVMSEITLEQQFTWLELLDKHLFGGRCRNGQISFTSKYDPKTVSFDEFVAFMRDNFRRVRCCTVMPIVDTIVFAYQPEQPIDKATYDEYVAHLDTMQFEVYDREIVDNCAGGVCAIDQHINGTDHSVSAKTVSEEVLAAAAAAAASVTAAAV